VVLTIEQDFITSVAGQGLDADLMRSYLAAWGEREAYAVSHVGWGMNPKARWDAMAFYDKNDFNGTELRAFAGNFLYSTGANEVAGRHTLGHFDLPLRNCTVELDGVAVITAGTTAGRPGLNGHAHRARSAAIDPAHPETNTCVQKARARTSATAPSRLRRLHHVCRRCIRRLLLPATVDCR